MRKPLNFSQVVRLTPVYRNRNDNGSLSERVSESACGFIRLPSVVLSAGPLLRLAHLRVTAPFTHIYYNASLTHPDTRVIGGNGIPHLTDSGEIRGEVHG